MFAWNTGVFLSQKGGMLTLSADVLLTCSVPATQGKLALFLLSLASRVEKPNVRIYMPKYSAIQDIISTGADFDAPVRHLRFQADVEDSAACELFTPVVSFSVSCAAVIAFLRFHLATI